MSICVSHQWISEWFSSTVEPEQIESLLNEVGLEVDQVIKLKPLDSQIVGGFVESTAVHPNADKLKCCKVRIAEDEVVDIVCGCPTVAANKYVVVALPGAKLPGGLKIKSAKLRGEPSNGMICSASELGLVEESKGILAFTQPLQLGQAIAEQFNLEDFWYDIDITPDRGDCLSVHGIVREIAAKLSIPYHRYSDARAVDLSVQDAQLTHASDAIASGDLGAYRAWFCALSRPLPETPAWMQFRLIAAGYRPIHFLVDLTNYLMHELGRPMHAFDAQKLQGKPFVRYAQQGETITLLDDRTCVLDEQMLVVADESGPIALAGVMGGSATAVSDQTTNVVFEIAQFSPKSIAYTSQKLKISTDSSQRFERGIDGLNTDDVCQRLQQLVVEVTECTFGQLYDYTQISPRSVIKLRLQRISKILGHAFSKDEVVEYLEKIACKVSPKDQDFEVQPPSHRNDLIAEIDLIEELIRLKGYDALPTSELVFPEQVFSMQNLGMQIKLSNVLLRSGFNEIISYSFIDQKYQKHYFQDLSSLVVANPISPKLSLMRPSVIFSLCEAVEYNLNRQIKHCRFFEFGKRFSISGVSDDQKEVPVLAGIVAGEDDPMHWSQSNHDVYDFFDMKGLVEQLLVLAHDDALTFVASDDHPLLHPNVAAQVLVNSNCVGWVGQLHPRFIKSQKLPKKTFAFELDMLHEAPQHTMSYQSFSKFPWSRKDFSFYASKNLLYSDILAEIWRAKPQFLVRVNLFDLYEEKQHGEEKSYSFALTFQAKDHTLTDDIIMGEFEKIISHLQRTLNIQLRGSL